MYKFESEMNTSKMNKLEIVTESEAKFNWSGQNKAHCAGASNKNMPSDGGNSAINTTSIAELPQALLCRLGSGSSGDVKLAKCFICEKLCKRYSSCRWATMN